MRAGASIAAGEIDEIATEEDGSEFGDDAEALRAAREAQTREARTGEAER